MDITDMLWSINGKTNAPNSEESKELRGQTTGCSGKYCQNPLVALFFFMVISSEMRKTLLLRIYCTSVHYSCSFIMIMAIAIFLNLWFRQYLRNTLHHIGRTDMKVIYRLPYTFRAWFFTYQICSCKEYRVVCTDFIITFLDFLEQPCPSVG